jgi:hypothetical protein
VTIGKRRVEIGPTTALPTAASCKSNNNDVCFSLDIVAKVFLGGRTKFFRAAGAFYERRLEGPYRHIQNRPRIFVVALKRNTAEKSKDQLSRYFPGRSIFAFCNNIRSEADIAPRISYVRSESRKSAQVSAYFRRDNGHEPHEQIANTTDVLPSAP